MKCRILTLFKRSVEKALCDVLRRFRKLDGSEARLKRCERQIYFNRRYCLAQWTTRNNWVSSCREIWKFEVISLVGPTRPSDDPWCIAGLERTMILGEPHSKRERRLQYGLVTGASSGIGHELVRQLVRERGMTVLATARRLDRLERLADELGQERVKILAGDLTDADFRRCLWERAMEFPGGLDLLVNNAGMGNYARFDEQDPAVIDQMIQLNVVALMDLTQRSIRHMIDRGGGQILEISSVLGFTGMPYSAAYSASKHAVNGLVKGVRGELKGTGVRIWAACPGRTTSEFSAVAMGPSGQTYKMPEGEPTERIVRAIVKGLDRRTTFIMPSLTARVCVGMSRWCPGLLDDLVGRWARKNRVPGLATNQTRHPEKSD